MNESAEPAREIPRWRTCDWAVSALASCPCHLPMLAIALAGAGMGVLLGKHGVIAALLLAALFILTFNRALRAFRDRACRARLPYADVLR